MRDPIGQACFDLDQLVRAIREICDQPMTPRERDELVASMQTGADNLSALVQATMNRRAA